MKKDSAVVSVYAEASGQVLEFVNITADPQLNSEALKITSKARGVTVRTDMIAGGYEDCVDLNNGVQDITVRAHVWYPVGKYLATIKGGSQRITLEGEVVGHGSETDIDIGNYSQQGNAPTGPVSLDLVSRDGSPIRVRLLNAGVVVLLNPTRQKYDVYSPWWAPLFRRVYVPLQDFLFKIGLRKN